MKKIYIFLLLAFVFIFPEKTYATTDVTGMSFNEFEKNAGDLTEGLLYPLVKDNLFDEGGYFKFVDPEEYNYDLSGLGEYLKAVEFYSYPSDELGNSKYIVIENEVYGKSLNIKIYGRIGNQAKLLIDVKHPDYVGEIASDYTYMIFSGSDADYVFIEFYRGTGFDLHQVGSTLNYKIDKNGVSEVSDIPEDAEVLRPDIYNYRTGQTSPESDDNYMFGKYMLVDYYNNYVSGQDLKEFRKFFGDQNNQKFQEFRQAIIPFASELAPDGPIDSTFAYTVFQEAKLNYPGQRELEDNDIFSQVNIFQDIENYINENEDNFSYEVSSFYLDRQLMEDFFEKYYKVPLVDGDYNLDLDNGGLEVKVSDGSLEFNFPEGYYQDLSEKSSIIAFSNFKADGDYALFKLGSYKNIMILGSCGIWDDVFSKNIIVRRDKLGDSYEFVPIYASKEEITDDNFNTIVSADKEKHPKKEDVEETQEVMAPEETQKEIPWNLIFILGIIGLIILIFGLGIYIYKRKENSKRDAYINSLRNDDREIIHEDEEEKIYCDQCGAEVKKEDIFCEKCGRDLRKRK